MILILKTIEFDEHENYFCSCRMLSVTMFFMRDVESNTKSHNKFKVHGTPLRSKYEGDISAENTRISCPGLAWIFLSINNKNGTRDFSASSDFFKISTFLIYEFFHFKEFYVTINISSLCLFNWKIFIIRNR